MLSSTPSIIEEDEYNENENGDQYDFDRLQFITENPTDSSLVTSQNEQMPQVLSSQTTGINSWYAVRLLLNVVSVSPHMLAHAEERLYQNLKYKYHGEYVRIRGDNLIWTVASLNIPKEEKTPIVLIHDFGCASGIWINNIDFLSSRRKLYMFDILGFGRSSRPDFHQTNTINAETKFVESIEDWRRAIHLETKFYLVGHGFGAYLATLYALRYGGYIQKLILLDPWGFNAKPDENQLNLRTPFWIKLITYFTQTWTSFTAFRYLGPLGLPLLKLLAPRWKRLSPVDSSNDRSNMLYEYLYHANVQPASGDVGFQALASWFGWAKDPIVQVDHSRIENMSDDIPIVFIYGSRTSIDNGAAHHILHQRGPHNTSIRTIHNAAHFFFMERPIPFHELMDEILTDVPRNCRSLASGDSSITTTELPE